MTITEATDQAHAQMAMQRVMMTTLAYRQAFDALVKRLMGESNESGRRVLGDTAAERGRRRVPARSVRSGGQSS